MKQRIFLSPPGLICCAGRNRDELYRSCLKGDRSGFVPYKDGKFPTGMILPLPEAAFSAETAAWAENTNIIRIMNAALEQIRPAVENAISAYGPGKIGVCLGSCDNGSENSLKAHRQMLSAGPWPAGAFPAGYSLRYQSACFPAEYIARTFGISGPVLTVATACASGASAIIRGAELIRSGRCAAVIAGGADIVSPTVFEGFNALEAVSDSLTMPFSKNRKGINLGEGAAFFLLNTREGEAALLGSGESADAHHMTAPGPDGEGPARAMRAALLDAGLRPEEIGYVNLHGTGTPLNDSAEALAMKAVFETPPAPAVPASSTKSVTGHTLGAAGALEAAICWMVLTGKKGLPVHCWDGEPPDDLPFLPGGPYDGVPSACMSNSFAFGGCNVSLILGSAGAIK